MKGGRNVSRVNTHRLTSRFFLSIWRPWRHDTQKT